MFYLNDLHQLVYAAVAGKDRLPEQQFRHHAAGRPNVNHAGVVVGAEYQFRRAVVARANVAHVGFTPNQVLCTTQDTREKNRWAALTGWPRRQIKALIPNMINCQSQKTPLDYRNLSTVQRTDAQSTETMPKQR